MRKIWENTLRIIGEGVDVEACLAGVGRPASSSHGDGLIDFDRLIPAPEGLLLTSARHDPCPDGAEGDLPCWRRNHWGTPFPPRNVTTTRLLDGRVGIVDFSSASSPPWPIIEEIARRYPDLEFDYAVATRGTHEAGRARRRPGGASTHEASRARRRPGVPWTREDAHTNATRCRAVVADTRLLIVFRARSRFTRSEPLFGGGSSRSVAPGPADDATPEGPIDGADGGRQP